MSAFEHRCVDSKRRISGAKRVIQYNIGSIQKVNIVVNVQFHHRFELVGPYGLNAAIQQHCNLRQGMPLGQIPQYQPFRWA